MGYMSPVVVYMFAAFANRFAVIVYMTDSKYALARPLTII